MKLLSAPWPLVLLCASYASAQQTTLPPEPIPLQTVMYVRLKPQTLVVAGATVATQRWSELATTNVSLRSRLAAPLSIGSAYAQAAVWRSIVVMALAQALQECWSGY